MAHHGGKHEWDITTAEAHEAFWVHPDPGRVKETTDIC